MKGGFGVIRTWDTLASAVLGGNSQGAEPSKGTQGTVDAAGGGTARDLISPGAGMM